MPFELGEKCFNDADLELARSSYARSPEPYQPWIDKLDLKQFYSLPIPKSYLYCTEDNVLPRRTGWHPRMSNRLGLFLVQMPGSHEVMFSNPVGLAEDYCGRARLAAEFAIANPLMSPSFNKQ